MRETPDSALTLIEATIQFVEWTAKLNNIFSNLSLQLKM